MLTTLRLTGSTTDTVRDFPFGTYTRLGTETRNGASVIGEPTAGPVSGGVVVELVLADGREVALATRGASVDEQPAATRNTAHSTAPGRVIPVRPIVGHSRQVDQAVRAVVDASMFGAQRLARRSTLAHGGLREQHTTATLQLIDGHPPPRGAADHLPAALRSVTDECVPSARSDQQEAVVESTPTPPDLPAIVAAQTAVERSRRSFLLGAAVWAGATACAGANLQRGQVAKTTTTAQPPTTTQRPTRPRPSAAGVHPGAGTASGSAQFVSRGPGSSKRVALTFHTDGDLALAAQLLEVLKVHQVPMTAFVVGKWLEANLDWGKRLVDGGHELANHTYSHLTFSKLSDAAMADEITRCRDVLARAGGSPGDFFRPSGTVNGVDSPAAKVLAAAGAAGYQTVLGYDVDPMDYRDPGARVAGDRVASGVHPGAIVSLHFGHPGTIDALPAIIDNIRGQGLSIVPAGALLAEARASG